MSLIQELKQIIAEYDLLMHPFYQAWTNGELSKEALQQYAAQYYSQVASFPRFISRVHTHCDQIEARKVLLENLVDEEIKSTDHPALWMQFAEGLGVSKEQVLAEKPFTETTHMVDEYYHLADKDWKDGLCALYAYECQVPEVSASKIDGLKQFYHIDDAKTLEFFSAHMEYDVEHSNQVATLIEQYCDGEKAKAATRRAAKALWQFLDGIAHAHGIECPHAA